MEAAKDFFSDLKSPDPSIRFSALSGIEDLPLTQSQRDDFRELLNQEKDPGIRFHMQKVLARFESSEQRGGTADAIEELLKKADRDEINLALMLESVKKADAPRVAAILRAANWPDFSAQLLPSVLKFIKKYGSIGDAAAVASFCRHNDQRVLIAAIEALEKLNPASLKELIVPLLINSSFGIRSRAVRILYRWDPSEALRHFESMLFSENQNEKQAALFHAFFFPFKQIESLMLRYISIETDAELIKKVGLVFMANPDRQIPARLLESRQACTGEKYKLIDAILKGVLQSLYQAKIVNAEPEQMLEMLETHFREKRIRLYVERYSLGLKSGDAETRLASALKLCELVRHGVEEPKELIREFLEKERDERVERQVRLFLHSGTIPSVVESQPKKLADYTPEERQRVFDAINKENYSVCVSQAFLVMSRLSQSEQLSLLKAVERFGTASETDVVAGFLQSDSPELLGAAIDALSVINPEYLHPILPQLIKHRFDEVKLAAIKVFALFDKKQAISLVEQMLFSIKPIQRRNAIFCLAHFDFHSVSNILLGALKKETDTENLQQIFSIIRSNANEEIFYQIYCESRSGKGSRQQYLEEACKDLAGQIAAGDFSTTMSQLYDAAESKLAEENAAKAQRASYNLEKIQKIRQNAEHKTLDADFVRFTVLAYAVGALLTALIWFLFLAPPASVKLVKPDKKPAVQVSAIKTVKGVVVEVNLPARQLLIVDNADDQQKYQICFPESYDAVPETGKAFHAQIKITGERNGVVSGDLLMAF